jgi:hypothetical protein
MRFVHSDIKADDIVVHSAVEKCRQIWLYNLDLQRIAGKVQP